MWVIFRDPGTIFNHLDKFVMALVADEDIGAFRDALYIAEGGQKHEFRDDVYFLQPLLTTPNDETYFVRKYRVWEMPA